MEPIEENGIEQTDRPGGRSVAELRADMRSALLGGARKFERWAVKLADDAGIERTLEVQRPSIARRDVMMKKAGFMPGTPPDKSSMARLQVQALVWCVYLPGTDTRVFDEADEKAIGAFSVGSFLDRLSEEALKAVNVQATVAEEAEKN